MKINTSTVIGKTVLKFNTTKCNGLLYKKTLMQMQIFD